MYDALLNSLPVSVDRLAYNQTCGVCVCTALSVGREVWNVENGCLKSIGPSLYVLYEGPLLRGVIVNTALQTRAEQCFVHVLAVLVKKSKRFEFYCVFHVPKY